MKSWRLRVNRSRINASGWRSVTGALLTLLLLVSAVSGPAYAEGRPYTDLDAVKSPQVSMMAVTATGILLSDMSVSTPEDLVRVLLGSSSIPFSNVRYSGAVVSAGQFSGAEGIIGFDAGIMLSTGKINNVIGPNKFPNVGYLSNTLGDSDLGANTYDAAVLEFDFVPEQDSIAFDYVFASEEYNEYVNAQYNDIFAFYVNGQNMAVVPGTSTPVSVNTINGGNPLGTNATNPQFYINNAPPRPRKNTEMDGLTVVLTLRAQVTPGVVNHLKLAIADVNDRTLDSNVFIKAGSFSGGLLSGPPQTNAGVAPTSNGAGWNKSNVTVSLQSIPTVQQDPVKEIRYQVAGAPEVIVPGSSASFVLSTEGTTTVTYSAVSQSGVSEQPKSLVVNIDKTLPNITGSPSKPANANGWYNADVLVTFMCTDSISGIATCANKTLTTEGANQSVSQTGTDRAGNSNTFTVSGINLDKTKPGIEATISRAANENGWYNAPVTVGFTCTDYLSGVESCSPEQIVTTDGANLVVTGQALDRAGNTHVALLPGINLDQRSPTITGTPDRPANVHGWYNAPVTITFTCGDSLSGMASCTAPIELRGEGTGLSATGIAADQAGNTASVTIDGVQIDLTAPETAAQGPDRPVDMAVVYFAASDNLSGVKATYHTIDGGPTQTGDQAVVATGGLHTVTYWSVDMAGNAGLPQTVTVQVDDRPPIINHINSPVANEFGWNNSDVTVTFVCNDENGIVRCSDPVTLTEEGERQEVEGFATDTAGNTASDLAVVNIDKTAPTVVGTPDRAANGAGWYNAPVTVTFACTDALSGLAACTGPAQLLTESTYQSAAGTATDKAGNTAGATVSGINIDMTAPVTTATAPGGWQRAPVTVTLNATDTLSGVTATYYSVNGGARQNGTSLVLTDDGITTITYWSEDKAGNAEAPKSATVQIDNAPPTITPSQNPAPNASGWNNTDVTVSFDCYDANGISFCSGPSILTADGLGQVVTGTATDIPGNSATAWHTVNIDKTAPVITGVPDRPANAHGWYNAPVSVTFFCDDALSGVVSCTPPTLLNAEGANQSAAATSVDQADNSATAAVVNINIDMTAPATTANAPTGIQPGATTVTLTASDNLSGVKETYFTVNGGAPQTGRTLTVTGGGIHTIRYWSVDMAENVEEVKIVTVQIDAAPPTITHTQSPPPNGYGWNNTNVTVSFICNDDSGLAFCTPAATIASEGAGQIVTGNAIDIAGNTATDAAMVNIDKTAPTVNYSGNVSTYTLDQQVSISCDATDHLSGVAVTDCKPISGPAYTFAFGTNTFTATATDKAGNTSTRTTTFEVVVTVNGACAVIDRLVPHQGLANSLCVKIKNSQEAGQRGQFKTELNNLDAFIQEVEAQRAKAKITKVNADILLEIAHYLQEAPPVEIDWRPGVGRNR